MLWYTLLCTTVYALSWLVIIVVICAKHTMFSLLVFNRSTYMYMYVCIVACKISLVCFFNSFVEAECLIIVGVFEIVQMGCLDTAAVD